MTLTKPYIPNDENVAVAWTRLYVLPELGTAGVATTLPETPIPEDGFLTLTSSRAGIAPVDLPTHHSLISVDAWAPTKAGGSRVGWMRASQLIARFIRATEDGAQTYGKPVNPGADYMTAVVYAVYRDNEPRRVPGDPSGYARYTLDVNVDWAIA